MGFKGASSWISGKIWKIQENYNVFTRGLVCSAQDWSSCSLNRNMKLKACNDHTQDVFLTCTGTRSPFTLVNYSGFQVSGHQQFLLLYNDGTVCGDYFSDNSADAICREMGYAGVQSWRTSFKKSEYHIALDDVICSEGNWKSCSYTTSHDCTHSKDVYLSCKSLVVQNNCPNPVNDTKRLDTENLDKNASLAISLMTLICIGSIVYAVKKYFQIKKLSKEKVDNDALIKKLQDQLKDLQDEKDSRRGLELLMRTTDLKNEINILTDEHDDEKYQSEKDQGLLYSLALN